MALDLEKSTPIDSVIQDLFQNWHYILNVAAVDLNFALYITFADFEPHLTATGLQPCLNGGQYGGPYAARPCDDGQQFQAGSLAPRRREPGRQLDFGSVDTQEPVSQRAKITGCIGSDED
jgi:hypothetical protein